MDGELIFRYGTVGAFTTAQALITRRYFEQIRRWPDLIMPCIDLQEDTYTLRSYISPEAKAITFRSDESVLEYAHSRKCDAQVFIVNEVQCFSVEQIEELRTLANEGKIVICYGLKSDFKTELFPASKRLIEIADRIEEIESICPCGRKASVNALIGTDGKIIRSGIADSLIGHDKCEAMCYHCWKTRDTGWFIKES